MSYSREAMRALFMLDAGERGRAIETIEKLASTLDALRDEQDLAAEAAASSGKMSKSKPADDGASGGDGVPKDDAADASTEDAKATPDPQEDSSDLEAIRIPGTLPLGTSGNFCLAPFSPTGDFVVALDKNITVVSLIDVIDGLNEASSE